MRWSLPFIVAMASLAGCRDSRGGAEATLEIRPSASGSPSPGDLQSVFAAQSTVLQSLSLHSEVVAGLPEPLRRHYDASTLASRLEVRPIRSSFILKLVLADPDPARATQVLDQLIAVYLKRVEKANSFDVRVLESARQR